LHFFSTQWREGTLGAVVMGFKHGGWCVGCCSLLMLLLFVAGVMNVVWVATLAALVLAERLTPRGVTVGRAAGVLLAVWGGWLIFGAR
jgi:predicted metal-binding membrane protein